MTNHSTPTFDENSFAADEIDVRAYLRLLRRWAWLLVLSAVLSGIAAYLVSKQMPPVYQARTTFLVMRAPEDRIPDAYAVYTELQQAKTYAQLVTTQAILDRTSALLGYEVDPNAINVKLIQDTQVIQVTVEDTDPERAAQIANTLVAAFTQYMQEIMNNRYASSEQTLNAQIEEVKKEIQSLQDALNNATEETSSTQKQHLESQINQIQTEITQLKLEIEKLTALGDALTEAQRFQLEDKRALLKQEQELLATYQKAYVNLVANGQPGSNADPQGRLAQIQTNLTLYQQIYTTLLTNLEAMRLSRLKNTPNIVQVEQAEPPLAPVRPRPLLNTLLAAIVGVMFSGGLLLLRESLDTRIKGPDQIKQTFGLPVLGYIPYHKELSTTGLNGSSLVKPRSAMGEAYRNLRINLEFTQPPEKEGARVILVTSSESGTGKTTTAINLAYALAQAHKRVLLIDTDLHRPAIHQRLKISNRVGLTTLFRKDIHPVQVVYTLQNNRLAVIPSGPLPPNPAALLSSPRMKAILNALRQRADYIILDSPPRLVSDALVLASIVDGVLIVVRPQMSHLPTLATLLEDFQRIHATVLGVAFNAVPIQRNSEYQPYAPYLAEQKYYQQDN